MPDKSMVEQVAEAIGTALGLREVAIELAEKFINARLKDFFIPLVRQALGEALGVDPEQIGPELVDEGVHESITAAYLASQWLNGHRVPKMVSELRQKYADQYEGLENDDTAKEIAQALLVVRDEEMILGNAVRDGSLKKKS